MAGKEPSCRGWLASGLLAYCDDTQAGKLIDSCSDSLRAFLSKPEPRREDWIPLDWLIEGLTLADRIAGTGDATLPWAIGRFVAAREAGAVQSLAARLLRPTIIMSLAPGLWSTHFRNAGRASARGRGERDVAVRLLDVPRRERVLCQAVGGWIEGFLHLGPRRDIVVRHVACASEGASACEYTATWTD